MFERKWKCKTLKGERKGEFIPFILIQLKESTWRLWMILEVKRKAKK